MAESDRTIDGAVTLGGRVYTKGQEAALARVLPAKDVARLAKKGVLKGDWGVAEDTKSDAPVDAALELKGSDTAETTDATVSTEPIAGNVTGGEPAPEKTKERKPRAAAKKTAATAAAKPAAKKAAKKRGGK
jgi:hypothetical protein